MLRKLLPFALLLTLACGKLKEPTDPLGGTGDPIDPTATFTRVQNEIFTPTCSRLGCHDRILHQEDQILVAGQAYSQTVNHPSVEMPNLVRVAPGDPANSYLYQNAGGGAVGGARMPQTLPPLDDAQIKLIR